MKRIVELLEIKNTPVFNTREKKIEMDTIRWDQAMVNTMMYKWGTFGDPGNSTKSYPVKILQKFTKRVHRSRYVLPETKLFSEQSKDPETEVLKFAKKYRIQTDPWVWKKEAHEFVSINEFFHREYRDKIDVQEQTNNRSVCSPCDSFVVAFNTIEESTHFWIKGTSFTLKKTGIPGYADYLTGPVIVFRLAPFHYHHIHMPVCGTIVDIVTIARKYEFSHVVTPAVVGDEQWNPYNENERKIVVFSTEYFGTLALMIVGACGIDTIILNKTVVVGSVIEKGVNIGHFEKGGSTVVLFSQNRFSLIDTVNQRQIGCNKIVEQSMQVGEVVGRTHDSGTASA